MNYYLIQKKKKKTVSETQNGNRKSLCLLNFYKKERETKVKLHLLMLNEYTCILCYIVSSFFSYYFKSLTFCFVFINLFRWYCCVITTYVCILKHAKKQKRFHSILLVKIKKFFIFSFYFLCLVAQCHSNFLL